MLSIPECQMINSLPDAFELFKGLTSSAGGTKRRRQAFKRSGLCCRRKRHSHCLQWQNQLEEEVERVFMVQLCSSLPYKDVLAVIIIPFSACFLLANKLLWCRQPSHLGWHLSKRNIKIERKITWWCSSVSLGNFCLFLAGNFLSHLALTGQSMPAAPRGVLLHQWSPPLA